MVAASESTSSRFITPSDQVLAGRCELFRFTRNDLDILLRQGVIPEDATTELLDGMIALKDRAAEGKALTTVGTDHRKTVEALSALRARIDNEHRHVEAQQPLVCREDHLPEPDFMVVHGTLASYSDLATAADAYCVVEVADSSYERDAGIKLIGYARAGIVQYIIINLRNRTAEVYTNPNTDDGTYSLPQIIKANETLSFRVSGNEGFAMKLKDILP